MTPNIDTVIPAQGFEVVRARIAEMLRTELHYQAVLTGSYDFEPNVIEESNNPYADKTDLPIVNVSIAKGTYSNKHQGSSSAVYQYFVEIITNSKSKKDVPGDYSASLKMQRILGMCRYILEDPKYKTLAFQAPFIMGTMVSDFDIAASPNRDDAYNTSMCRLTFEVRLNESNSLIVPPSIAGYDTHVTLDNTNNGYLYIGNTYNP